MRPGTLESLLLKQAGSLLAETLEKSLQAAGASVTTVRTPYEAIAKLARMDTFFRHVIVGVDHFGKDEFRLFPLLRREWPDTILVVYHSPGFEYKGELATFIGVDIVLADCDDIARFLERLSPVSPVQEMAPVPQPPAGAVAFLAGSRPAVNEAPRLSDRPEMTEPGRKPPESQPQAVEAEHRTTAVHVTEEERRLLLGEEDPV